MKYTFSEKKCYFSFLNIFPFTVPGIAPLISTHHSTRNTLSFSWNEITCGSRRGPGLQYEFRLKLAGFNGNIIQNWQKTQSTSALFSDLNACTSYKFEVRAINNAGRGDASSRILSTSEISK